MLKNNKYFYNTVVSIIILISIALRVFFQIKSQRLNIISSYQQHALLSSAMTGQAFIFLDSLLMKTYNPRNQYISQEVIINGIDNLFVKKRILTILDINESSTKVMSTHDLALLLSRLKLSGFFTNVSLNQVSLFNHQIVKVNVSINPVLKQISIVRYSEKIIPYSYLLFIFRNQVGYPLSFDKIDKCLNLITKWYHNRGYKWAFITLLRSCAIDLDVIIDINEGVISKIKLTSYTQSMVSSKDNMHIPVSLFLAIMQVHPSAPLNINNLEQGILRLKNQKLILNCHYEIFWSKEITNGLSLILKIEMADKQSIYLFNKNIAISTYIMDSIESLAKYSLYNIFKKINDNEVLKKSKDSSLNNQSLNLMKSKNILYSNICKEDNYFQQLISYRLSDTNQYFSEWYTSKFLFIIADHIGFKYSRQNIFIGNSYCFFDTSFPCMNMYPYCNFKYEFPWISNHDNKVQHLIGHIFSTFFDSNHRNKLLSLEHLSNSYFYFQESLGQELKVSLDFLNYHNKNFFYQEKIMYSHIAYKYLNIHNYTNWYELKNIKDNFVKYAIYSYFQPVCNYSRKQMNQYHMNIKYSNPEYSISDLSMEFKTIYFIPEGKEQIFYQTKDILNYGNQTSISYRQTYNIKRHKLRYISKLTYLLGPHNYLPSAQELLEIDQNNVRKYTKKVFPFPLKFGKINLEYHIPLLTRNTVFCFVNYLRCITNNDISSQYNIYLDKLRYQRYHKPYNWFSYGLGLHIIVPIRQIPPMRLEYSYHLDNKHCLNFRVYKQ